MLCGCSTTLHRDGGKKGDQDINTAQNKTLSESNT